MFCCPSRSSSARGADRIVRPLLIGQGVNVEAFLAAHLGGRCELVGGETNLI
jgi:hypothetical protein